MQTIERIIKKQDSVIKQQVLLSVAQRIDVLTQLRKILINNAELIAEALRLDLGKSAFESYLSEIDFVVHEIDCALKYIQQWVKPKKVRSPLLFFPSSSYIYPEPYGKVFIIAPWNYPVQLLLAPVVGAIAAGNTVILKPSEIAAQTSKVLHQLINENIDESYLAVVEGGVEETTQLLNQKFDYIFYTGNGTVGRIVMQAAAKHLTPLTLELGGKSPCLVYSDRIDLSAKRIVWGKFFNAGQTCVAPDYVIIPSDKKQEFISACKKWLIHFYGDNIQASTDYGRIINTKHFDRIIHYLNDANIVVGGKHNREQRYIEPTIVNASIDSDIMKEEIFGPVLPIICLDTLEQAIAFVNERDKPLACYAFLDKSNEKKKVARQISSGGMVINDTIIHLSNDSLPFGGVGESGMGGYHGKHSFDLFSHKKAIMQRSFMFENALRYPPYKKKLNFVRKLVSWFS